MAILVIYCFFFFFVKNEDASYRSLVGCDCATTVLRIQKNAFSVRTCLYTLHSISMFIVRARRSRLSRTVVPILCHSHRSYTIRTAGIRVILHSNNNIYLFNFLFMSNGNGDSIIIRPTLVTLYFIIMHSLQLMFV